MGRGWLFTGLGGSAGYRTNRVVRGYRVGEGLAGVIRRTTVTGLTG